MTRPPLRTILIPSVVSVLGLLLVAIVVRRGGAAQVVGTRLEIVAPIVFVGIVTVLATLGVGSPRINRLHWLGAIVVFGVLNNIVAPFLVAGRVDWRLLLPVGRIPGLDFQLGLYQPARVFSTAGSGWPPFTLLIGKPFTLLQPLQGYYVQVAVLVVLAFASCALIADIAVASRRGEEEPDRSRSCGGRRSLSCWPGCSRRTGSRSPSSGATWTSTRCSSRHWVCGCCCAGPTGSGDPRSR